MNSKSIKPNNYSAKGESGRKGPGTVGQLNATLSGIEQALERIHRGFEIRNKNELARLHNRCVRANDELLRPLVHIKDGTPIPDFPATIGDLIQLETEPLLRCIGALAGHPPITDFDAPIPGQDRKVKDMTSADLNRNKEVLAMHIGIYSDVIRGKLK